MKSSGLILILIFILMGCANPVDPTKSGNPVFGSMTAVISGSSLACENCLILETSNNAVRVTFSENGIEECSGEGTLSYLSQDTLTMPAVDGEITTWSAQVVGENNSKNPFCFPDQLNLTIEQISNNNFELDYNGKIFTIRKLN